MKQLLYKIFAFAVVLSMTACSDFLDINEDPNNPSDAKLSDILPSVQVNLAGAFGASAGGLGNFTSMYIHHTVQRGNNQNDYGFQGGDFGVSTPWRLVNTFALNDLEQMLTKATEVNSGPYLGVGKLMKAYIYSIMVDMYGDIPFSEAQTGAENLFPNFDDDAAIYTAIFEMIDAAILDLEGTSTFTPGTDDLFYGGDLDKWTRFGKTLKLKLLTQTRLVNDVSKDVLDLLAEGDLIGAGEDFEMQYGTATAPENRNPAYAQEYAAGGARNYISPYFFEIMNGLSTFHDNDIYQNMVDPRVPYYFFNQIGEISAGSPPENPCSYCYGYNQGGNFVVQVPELQGSGMLGIYMFSFNIDPNEGFDQSSSQTVLGLYPIGGRFDDGNGGAVNFNGQADTPQRLLTYYARKFLEAELALTGISDGDARAEFQTAMEAAFAKVDEVASAAGAPALVDSLVTQYIDDVLVKFDAADDAGKLEHIMTQKWIATFGFGVDAYTDFRRTGYPRLHDPNTDNLNVTSSGRLYPVAFPYPQTEIDRNPNAPAQRNITTDGVFWDN